MSEETPDFNIDSGGGMTAITQFTHNGHQVEIIPPDTTRLIGNYWQIKVDGPPASSAIQLVKSGGGPSENTDRPNGLTVPMEAVVFRSFRCLGFDEVKAGNMLAAIASMCHFDPEKRGS
jgi:hypothetical protein